MQRVATGLAARPGRPLSQSIPARLRSYSQAAAVPTSNLAQSAQDSIAVSISRIVSRHQLAVY